MSDEGDTGKIELITLIEPLTSVITRSKENGVRLTALAVMAIVNMCNFSADIKDIFLQRNGIAIINDLMDSKDEEILMNALRLVMTLIASKKGETNMIGRQLAEDSDNKIIKRLIGLIKQGPEINYCHFSNQVLFMSISLLRAFIQHSTSTKSLFMNDKHDLKYTKPIKDVLLDYMHPQKIWQITPNIEEAILSLMT